MKHRYCHFAKYLPLTAFCTVPDVVGDKNMPILHYLFNEISKEMRIAIPWCISGSNRPQQFHGHTYPLRWETKAYAPGPIDNAYGDFARTQTNKFVFSNTNL